MLSPWITYSLNWLLKFWILSSAVITACGQQSNTFLISTVSGDACGPGAGLAIDPFGNLYSSDRVNLCMIKPNGSVTLLATNIGISNDGRTVPYIPMAADSAGNVYFQYFGNVLYTPGNVDAIKKFSPDGTVTEVLRVSASALAVDQLGTLYFGSGNAINRLSSGGAITKIAGGITGFSGDGGPATSAALGSVQGLTFDNSGNLFFADGRNSRIRKITPSGIINTVATSATSAVAVSSQGNLYDIASDTNSVEQLFLTGAPIVVAGGGIGSGDGGPATQSALLGLTTIVADRAGNLFISGVLSSIRKLIPSPPIPSGCLYGSQTSANYFHQAGGTMIASVAVSNPGCAWLVSNHSDWVTVSNRNVIVGDGSVMLTVAPAVSPLGRQATIGVAGLNIDILQDGVTCTFTLKSIDGGVPAAGGLLTLNVSANLAACPWNTMISSNWIVPQGKPSGAGNGSLLLSILPNPGAVRSGTVSIGNTSFNVIQTSLGSVVPALTTVGTVNGASRVGGTIAPGEVITLSGNGLGPIAGSSGFAKNLANVSVDINGIPCFISYASLFQINLITPFAIDGLPMVDIVVRYQGVPSNTVLMPVSSSLPGIFTIDGSGIGQAVVANEDGSLNSPANRATKGSLISFFFTGQGNTNPVSQDGIPPGTGVYPSSALALGVNIGGIMVPPGDIVFSGLVYAGIMQTNVRVPPSLTVSESTLLSVTVGAASSRSGVTFFVQ